MASNKPKIIVILGPTASGKSDLAVKIALRLPSISFRASRSGQAKKLGINGAEIISADSRQVYKGMDIGTGKITPDSINHADLSMGQAKKKPKLFTHKGIVHYCIDYVSPKKVYTVVDFKKCGEKAITEILEKKKIPIICGGTGFYIHSLLSGAVIPKVPPDWKLRKKLEKKTTGQLFEMLKKLDPIRAKNIDQKNPRRLIRSIEIAKALGKIPPATPRVAEKYNILWLGIKKNDKELKNLIKKRLMKRLKMGMIGEVRKLHTSGVSWKRLDDLGLEYRYISRYLQNKISQEEMIEQLNNTINQFAKRQMTWFKKYAPETRWIKNYKEAFSLTEKFLD